MTTSFRFGGTMPATADSIQRARRRIALLEAGGLSRREIARRAGVAASSVVKIANDPAAHVSRPVVAAILTVTR